MMNWILQNNRCQRQRCHLNSSFSASVKLRLLSWTVLRKMLRAAAAFGVSELRCASEVGKLLSGLTLAMSFPLASSDVPLKVI
jgi:hypothetical protein